MGKFFFLGFFSAKVLTWIPKQMQEENDVLNEE